MWKSAASANYLLIMWLNNHCQEPILIFLDFVCILLLVHLTDSMTVFDTSMLIFSALHKFFFQSYQFTCAKMLTSFSILVCSSLSTANNLLMLRKSDLDSMKVQSSEPTILPSSQYHWGYRGIGCFL